MMKHRTLILIVLSICPFLAGSQQYNIVRQGVCWTTPMAVDSSLTRLVYVSVSGAGPISVNYVNSYGVSVDVSGGGSFEMGYCGCCAPAVDSSAIDVLYYTDGDSIVNGDTILYKDYDNHVFLSQQGDNFTGQLGNFNRPFASPWEAQDVLAEDNLSFLGYQGDYSYSGVGAGNEFTRVDTFTLFDLSNSTYSMLNVTGSNSTPFVTDRTLPGAVSTQKRIFINAPNSEFVFSDLLGLSIFGGTYNRNSELTFAARKVTATGGRVWGFQSAARSTNVKIDSITIEGGIIYSFYLLDFTAASSDTTITRSANVKIGYAQTGGVTDLNGAIRMQGGTSGTEYRDSLTSVSVAIGQIETTTEPIIYLTNDRAQFFDGKIGVEIGKAERKSSGLNKAITIANAITARDSNFVRSSLNINVQELIDPNGVICLGCSGTTNGYTFINSEININIENAAVTSNSVQFDLNGLVLRDSSTMIIDCKNCRFDANTTQPIFDIRRCNIEAGSKLIIKGFYNAPNLVGDAVYLRTNNVDLTGLSFENATFINDGISEWIRGESAFTITENSGLWSNSDSAVNVTLQANDFWGFAGCDGAYTHLQEVLDGVCDSIAAIPADLNVAQDDLVANGSHTTDWLDHTIEFDFTGAPSDTIVYAWPSPDGEVQGLYISDGAQEMALLMNDVRGTDFANIINYNLADEIVFGNTGDTVTVQADKWRADVVNMVRADTVRSVLVIDSDDEIKLKYVPISGRVSDTTDGSGDIVIPLGVTMGSVNFTALVGARGTTFQQAQVIANTATQITVRVMDDSGAPITGSAVVVDWMVMDY